MGKRNIQNQLPKIKTRLQPQQITHQLLKRFALNKLNQLHRRKNHSTKISKATPFVFETPKRILKVKKELFKDIIDESILQCPVCLQLMIQPTLLQCGHAYCAKCIQQLMIYKSNCGVCRNVQCEPQFQRSKYLETLIEKVILPKSKNYLDYYCRVTDAQNWKRARNVSIQQLGKGSFIDFRDKQLKWRKGEITKVFYDEQKANYQMQIKYNKQSQSMLETLTSDSGRYAKFTYYTRKKYLEPKQNQQTFQYRQSDEAIYTPLPSSFLDRFDGIDQMLNQQEESASDSVSEQNISIERNQLSEFNHEESQFLNQVLRIEYRQGIDLIQLLV